MNASTIPDDVVEAVARAIRDALEAKDSILETLMDDEVEAAARAALAASPLMECVEALRLCRRVVEQAVCAGVFQEDVTDRLVLDLIDRVLAKVQP